MKRSLVIPVFVLIGVWAHAQTWMEDPPARSAFEAVVAEVETHYAGFSDKVTPSARPSYDTMLGDLRGCVSGNNAADCIGKYLAWFEDLHLRARVEGHWLDTYGRKPVSYADSMVYAPRLSAGKVNGECFLIRLPSLALQPGPSSPLVKMIRQYKRSRCPFLILDLRGNHGGNDWYIPLVELAYDHPAVIKGTTFRNTGENREFLLEGMRGNRPIGKALRESVGTMDSLAVLRGDYALSFKKVSSWPRRMAVILDNQVASNAESLILTLQSVSGRVVLYGREPTMGCADYANARPFIVPSLGMVVMIPTCRSGRLPDTPVDPSGIAPEVLIPLPLPGELTGNIDAWTRWVAEDLAASK